MISSSSIIYTFRIYLLHILYNVYYKSINKKGFNIMNIPKEIDVVEIVEFGGPEKLIIAKRAAPKINSNELLIKVKAAGVNRPDIMQRQGLYPPPPGASDIPGLEVAGEVVAIDSNESDFKIGDKVCALVS